MAGEGGIDGESNMETHITIRKIDSQWELANNSWNSTLASVAI